MLREIRGRTDDIVYLSRAFCGTKRGRCVLDCEQHSPTSPLHIKTLYHGADFNMTWLFDKSVFFPNSKFVSAAPIRI
jgi:hypothetical protein